jgi:hypothetical protein
MYGQTIASSYPGRAIWGRGGCKDHDLILKAPVPIVAESAVSDVRQYLLQHGFIIPGLDSRIDISPLPVDTDAQQAFCDWMGMPWEALAVLRSTPLMVFTHLRTREAWQQFFPLVYWQRLASRCLYPLVPGSLCSTEDDGYHGLSHGLETALIAIIISYSLGVPAAHGFLAALCHDLKAGPDESAEIFAALLDGAWRDYAGAHDQRMMEPLRTASEPLISPRPHLTRTGSNRFHCSFAPPAPFVSRLLMLTSHIDSPGCRSRWTISGKVSGRRGV